MSEPLAPVSEMIWLLIMAGSIAFYELIGPSIIMDEVVSPNAKLTEPPETRTGSGKEPNE